MVFGAPPRSTEDLLGTLAPALMDESGERCYDPAGLTRHVRGRVAAAAPGRSVTIETGADSGLEWDGARGARLAAGCAIVIGVGPAANGHDLVVTILREG
jgi:hypothetical protein